MSNAGEIEISVVLPCLNEEEGVAICVKKIKALFARENLRGEVIVVDNASTDRTAEVATNAGARVVQEPLRGYGAAYLRGFHAAKGNFIVMGDADDTYDFNDIPQFINKLRAGCELVLGSRFRGSMQKGAMTWSHRYIGNPIITAVFRIFFRTYFSDVLTGMRAFTRAALTSMNLKCLGMEFGTEMILSALQKNLKIEEIPIDYHPRLGKSKLRPFRDAWRYFRFMLLFSPTSLFMYPGVVLCCFGLFVLIALSQKPLLFLGHTWDVHAMILGSLLTLLGIQIIFLGIYAKIFAIREGYLGRDKTISFLLKNFQLEFGIGTGLVFFLTGFFINILIFIEWWNSSFGSLHRIREGILAMTFMIMGLQIIFSSFFVSVLLIRR